MLARGVNATQLAQGAGIGANTVTRALAGANVTLDVRLKLAEYLASLPVNKKVDAVLDELEEQSA
jgi:plasmid maintenance system antidote protein VapI